VDAGAQFTDRASADRTTSRTVEHYAPVFSPDSRRVAYEARRKDRQFVVVDGAEGKEFEPLEPGNGSVFSSAYSLDLLLDSFSSYDWIDPRPVFSPDSKRLAHVLKRGTKLAAVVDGEEGEEYDSIGPMVFSPDSKRFGYRARRAGKLFAVIDGAEGPAYDGTDGWDEPIVFGPDSKHTAYVGGNNKKSRVVIDGKEGKEYLAVDQRSIVFSPDSQHVAYVASIPLTGILSQDLAVVDGKEGKGCRAVLPPGIVFSPDSKRTALRPDA